MKTIKKLEPTLEDFKKAYQIVLKSKNRKEYKRGLKCQK